MFAYLVIGFELAILYTVFWYVFIREPKPFKIRADHWGRYQQDSNHFTAYGAKLHPPDDPTNEINERQLYNHYINHYINQARRRAAVNRRRMQRSNSSLSYGTQRKQQLPFELIVTRDYDRVPRSAVERLFHNLTRAISQLSAKTPLA